MSKYFNILFISKSNTDGVHISIEYADGKSNDIWCYKYLECNLL